MGKKGLVTSIFAKLVDTSPASSPGAAGQPSPPSWPWPSCGNAPQTTSFRVVGDEDPCCASRAAGPGMTTGSRLQLRGAAAAGEMYKTVNSVYFDSAVDDYFSLDGAEDGKEEEVMDDESCFSTTTASEEWSEAVIRSLGRSTSTHRFFFDPEPPAMNSVLPAATVSSPATNTTTTPPDSKPATAAAAPIPDPDLDDNDDDGRKQQQPCTSKSSLAEGSVAVAVDSSDPFGDFRASMAEMVAAHGLREWAALEELLWWYLRVNAKHNHPLIVGAFLDLLIGLASSATTSATTTTTTTTSSSSSSGKGTKSSITTSTTTATASTSTATERCGGGGGANGASCSSSSSCATPDSSQDAAEDEKASGDDPSTDDDHIRRGECGHQCRST